MVYIHFCLIDPKIKIFRDFRGGRGGLSPLSKNENSKITEFPQKLQNTEIWECSFKNLWNIDIILKMIQPPC